MVNTPQLITKINNISIISKVIAVPIFKIQRIVPQQIQVVYHNNKIVK